MITIICSILMIKMLLTKLRKLSGIRKCLARPF